MKVNQMRMASQSYSTNTNVSNSSEFSRLVSAAVVSEEFCTLLLHNPARALNNGYNGETFDFSPKEYARITSVRAASLPEFVVRILELDGEPLPNVHGAPTRMMPIASQA